MERSRGMAAGFFIPEAYLIACDWDYLRAAFLSQVDWLNSRWSGHLDVAGVAFTAEQWEEHMRIPQRSLRTVTADLKERLLLEVMVRRSRFHQYKAVAHYKVNYAEVDRRAARGLASSLPLLIPEIDENGQTTSAKSALVKGVPNQHSYISVGKERKKREERSPESVTLPSQPLPEVEDDGRAGLEEPDHLTPDAIRAVRAQTKGNDTLRRMNASSLCLAWVECQGAQDVDAQAELLWSGGRNREIFLTMTDQGCTPEELKALYKDRSRPGSRYLLRFAAEDYPEWAREAKAKLAAGQEAPSKVVRVETGLGPDGSEGYWGVHEDGSRVWLGGQS